MALDRFKGEQFPKCIVLQAVYWYCRFALSYRDIEELMQERGVDVDHSTIQRWVIKHLPELELEFRRRHKTQVGRSWRMDETYLKPFMEEIMSETNGSGRPIAPVWMCVVLLLAFVLSGVSECPLEQDNDGDGYTVSQGDCADDDLTVYPGAEEICDEKDSDCDDVVPPTEIDNDGDGRTECGGNDCDDSYATIYPGAPELCDGKDNDCDGQTDEGVTKTYYQDKDGDGYGDPYTATQACSANPGWVLNSQDCDDDQAAAFPGGNDNNCDGVDNDCDGVEDSAYVPIEECSTCNLTTPWKECKEGNLVCPDTSAPEICDGVDNDCNGVIDDGLSIDADGDGHYTSSSCWLPRDDCNDGDSTIYPGASELCDGKDNDCQGSVPITETDDDGDGLTECGGNDCNDGDKSVYPGASELCDGKDNDCNGKTDEGLSVDADGDGHYTSSSCATPKDDCKDSDKTIYPGAQELCDGKDNDCNGIVPATEIDNDGDGRTECGGNDCDDSYATVYPGAPELCDGKDNDCNGQIPASEIDNDGDGRNECAGNDCDDENTNVHPGALETCNGQDDNCDGQIDSEEACGDLDYLTSGGSAYLILWNPKICEDPPPCECCPDIVDEPCDCTHCPKPTPICYYEWTWWDLADACHSYGYHVVTVYDQAENDWLISQMDLDSIDYAWIGLNDIQVEGSFVWDEDGSPATWTHFYGDVPPGESSNDCVALKDTGYWYNLNCSKLLSTMICEAN